MIQELQTKAMKVKAELRNLQLQRSNLRSVIIETQIRQDNASSNAERKELSVDILNLATIYKSSLPDSIRNKKRYLKKLNKQISRISKAVRAINASQATYKNELDVARSLLGKGFTNNKTVNMQKVAS